jgi:hypothetical protein
VQPAVDPPLAVPLQGVEVVAHRVERALDGAQVHRLMRRVLAQADQPGLLEPFLQPRHVGVPHRPRWRVVAVVFGERLHQQRRPRHLVVGECLAEIGVFAQRQHGVGEVGSRLAIVVGLASGEPCRRVVPVVVPVPPLVRPRPSP